MESTKDAGFYEQKLFHVAITDHTADRICSLIEFALK